MPDQLTTKPATPFTQSEQDPTKRSRSQTICNAGNLRTESCYGHGVCTTRQMAAGNKLHMAAMAILNPAEQLLLQAEMSICRSPACELHSSVDARFS